RSKWRAMYAAVPAMSTAPQRTIHKSRLRRFLADNCGACPMRTSLRGDGGHWRTLASVCRRPSRPRGRERQHKTRRLERVEGPLLLRRGQVLRDVQAGRLELVLGNDPHERDRTSRRVLAAPPRLTLRTLVEGPVGLEVDVADRPRLFGVEPVRLLI